MWITEVCPQEEWFVGWLLVKKFADDLRDFDIRTGVQKIDAIGKRAQPVLLEELSYTLTAPVAGSVQVITSTTDSREVTGVFAEQLRKRHLVARQR